MLRLIVNWILSACALVVVSRLVPGFHIDSPGTALAAALVFGFLNATVGLVLKIISLPAVILSLGVFLVVINAFVLEMAATFVPGFHIRNFHSAFWGAVVLAVLQLIFRVAAPDEKRR